MQNEKCGRKNPDQFGFVGDNMMEQKRLGDIATYINGFSFKPEDRSTVGLPIIRIQDLTGNTYDLGFYDGSYPKRIEINDGDVLISWSASLGIYVWNRGKALLNQHIFKVAFDKCDVNREFFVYAVRHKLKEMESKTHGATMKHIVKKDFDNTLIPFPTLNEQGKIAKLLDTVDTIISARQQQLQKLDELVKARFVEMFGDVKYGTERWGEKPFKDITINLDSKRKPVKEADRKKMQGIYPYYGATGIVDYVNDYRQDGDFLLISEDGKALELRSKPIAFLASGKIWVNNHAHVQQCTDECNMIYLMYHINFMDVSIWVTGIDQKKLNRANLDTIPIALPPIELQEQFADFVNQVTKSKVAVQKALDEAQLLFDSLMQQYFG